MTNDTQNEIETAVHFGHITATENPVAFKPRLAGPDGAWFTLFRQPHHSDADLKAAKAFLRATDDVVGFSVHNV
jgi:hypothetical protein